MGRYTWKPTDQPNQHFSNIKIHHSIIFKVAEMDHFSVRQKIEKLPKMVAFFFLTQKIHTYPESSSLHLHADIWQIIFPCSIICWRSTGEDTWTLIGRSSQMLTRHWSTQELAPTLALGGWFDIKWVYFSDNRTVLCWQLNKMIPQVY